MLIICKLNLHIIRSKFKLKFRLINFKNKDLKKRKKKEITRKEKRKKKRKKEEN